MKEIAIYGAGGQGREILQLIRQINANEELWRCIGWFDDGVPVDTEVAGLPVLGGINKLNNWSKPLSLSLAIGWPATKKKIFNQIKNSKVSFPVLIHPEVILEKGQVFIGEGSVITQGCRLTVDIEIGKHVLLNLGCTLTHDCKIGDFCGLMPSVNVSGEVQIEEEVYIGTGAKIIQQLTIGQRAIIGAGAVVIQNIPSDTTVVGVPAKVIKSNN